MKDVQQKTLEKGVETTFEMTLSRTQFLVKISQRILSPFDLAIMKRSV